MLLKSVGTLFAICILLTISAANTVSTDQQECPQVCPVNYAPLCATNGKIYKEFSNICELKASNCRLERSALQKYVATSIDWCKTELIEGFQQLLAKLDNLDLNTSNCLKACPLIYSPVCVSNGKYRAEISNLCLMEGLNCALAKNNKAAFKILDYDSC